MRRWSRHWLSHSAAGCPQCSCSGGISTGTHWRGGSYSVLRKGRLEMASLSMSLMKFSPRLLHKHIHMHTHTRHHINSQIKEAREVDECP